MTLRLLLIGISLVAVTSGQDKQRRIGEIDFYGYGGLDLGRIRAALTVREGAAFHSGIMRKTFRIIWIAKDPSILGMNIALIGRQVQTDFRGRIDLLALDRDANCVVLGSQEAPGRSSRLAVKVLTSVLSRR